MKIGCALRNIVVIAASVLLIAGCTQKPAAKMVPFPASNEVAGWSKAGDTRTFDATNLYRYIDGDAEKYLKAGVQSAATADYKFQDKVEAVADIYTMQDADGAQKIFEAEPTRNGKPVQLGDRARLYRQSLILQKGRYLVRVVAYDELPGDSQPIVELGRGIEQRLAK